MKKNISFILLTLPLFISTFFQVHAQEIHYDASKKGDISAPVTGISHAVNSMSYTTKNEFGFNPQTATVILLIAIIVILLFIYKTYKSFKNDTSSVHRRRLRSQFIMLAILIGLAGSINIAQQLQLFKDFTSSSSASSNPIKIVSIATNNSSAIVTFEPVAGAKDYRMYDMANPSNVKYAGMVHVDTGSAQYWSVAADNALTSPIVALQDGWPLNSLAHGHYDSPSLQIEWNNLQDHQPHTLVVEAVDQLGPAPKDNLYDVTDSSIKPLNQNSNTRLGLNMGMTNDGKMSTNGQGDPNNNPQVIASSQPFTVTAPASVQAIPSGSDAEQTFFDTFDDSEKPNLVLVNSSLGANPSGNLSEMNYTLNKGLPNSWKIKLEAADINNSYPFLSAGHFMDVIFNEHPGSSWTAMGMAPDKTVDISGGKMLHMTMEVDTDLDFVSRRWVGFEIAPASDPLQSRKERDFTNGDSPNNSDQALFINIFRGRVDSNLYTGKGADGNPILNTLASDYNPQATWLTGTVGGARALDKRAKLDLFVTSKHVAMFENGSLLTQYDLPGNGFAAAPYNNQLATSYSHYYYHTEAEIPELQGNNYPYQTYFMNIYPYSDERHWDNMGFEVLPAASIPSDWRDLTDRAQPVLDHKDMCPTNFSCKDIGPYDTSGRQHAEVDGWTIQGPSIQQANFQTVDTQDDAGRFIYQSSPTANISARVITVAKTGYGSEEAGIFARQSTQWEAPIYKLVVNHANNSEHVHVIYRTTQNGAVKDVDTGIDGTNIFLKITSNGNSFTGFSSTDGTAWTQLPNSAATISMGSQLLQGLLEDSESNVLGMAKFDSIMINGVAITTSSPIPSQGVTTIPTSIQATNTPIPNQPTNTPAPQAAGTWTDISPAGVSKDFNNPPNNYGFSTIAVDPSNPTTIYTGTNYQGLYKSTNGGASWVKINTGMKANLVDSGRLWTLAIDPFNSQTIYTTAGYGDGGVLKSTNGGKDWEQMLGNNGLNGALAQQLGTNDVYGIYVDPYTQNHVLASFHYYWHGNQDSGIIESTDGGNSWIIHNPPANSGWGAGNSIWILDKSSIWLFGSQNNGIWKSTDNGTTWKQVYNQNLTHGGQNAFFRDPNSGTLYLAMWTQIIKSTTNGDSWIDLTSGLPFDSWEAIIGDGSNLYTKPAFPDGAADKPGPYYTISYNGTAWKAYNNQSIGMGPFQMAYDPVNHIVYSANGLAGVYKLLTTGSGTTNPTNTPVPNSTATPTPRPTNTPTPRPTNTPVPLATNTPIPQASNTPVPTPTTGGTATTLVIYAQGSIGNGVYPTMKLSIKDIATNTWITAKTWTNVDSVLKTYTYTTSTPLTADRIRVRFTNDYYGGTASNDRNLRVDKIILNGTTYESEAPTVYSIGSWSSTNGCSGGYKQQEWLTCNGYFQYK